MPTDTVENYLKAIHALELRNPPAAVPAGDLAQALAVAPGTVTAMLKKLGQAKLAKYEKYSGVKLTAKGRKAALSVLRRHRIVETFLVRTLGFDWADVHEEAERMEHAISEHLVDRLDDFLGRPAVDPHGDPIPDADGKVRSLPLVAIAACKVGVKVRVSRVLDQSTDFLRFADRHQLRPGAMVTVINHEPGAGTITLQGPQNAPVTLSHHAAQQILVQPAS